MTNATRQPAVIDLLVSPANAPRQPAAFVLTQQPALEVPVPETDTNQQPALEVPVPETDTNQQPAAFGPPVPRTAASARVVTTLASPVPVAPARAAAPPAACALMDAVPSAQERAAPRQVVTTPVSPVPVAPVGRPPRRRP
jgi:hypothetical protein